MTLIQRRELLLAGAGTLAGLPAAAQPEKFADLYAKAKAEGELTWYVAHFRTETCEQIAQLFAKTYPGVKCNVVRATGQVIFQRLNQDMKAKAQNCDVFSGTDTSHSLALRKANMLASYKPRSLSEIEPVVREACDPDGFFTATDTNMTLLFYSTKAIAAADAPKRFNDLIDPKWAGQIAIAHPGFSGAMGAWVVLMDKMYGWSWFEKLAKNKPHVSRSLADPPLTISNGERKWGIGPATMAPGLIAKGTPIATVVPEEGAQLGFGQTSIISNSKHPNAARLFLEFQLSKPVGDMMAEIGSISVRPDVKPHPHGWKAGSVKGLRLPPAEIEAKLPELTEKWRDTFGV